MKKVSIRHQISLYALLVTLLSTAAIFYVQQTRIEGSERPEEPIESIANRPQSIQMSEQVIPKTQTAAIVQKQGGPVEFDDNYPVTQPGDDEILVKVLYTGVCQSGQYHSILMLISSRC